jgi:translation initiation factor 3 subunit I
MWELQTGKELFQFRQQEPCRACNLSVGEGMLAFTTDAFMGTQSMIHIVKLEQDIQDQSAKSILSIECPKGRITRVYWSELNRALVTSHDGGFLRKWDSEVGVSLFDKPMQYQTKEESDYHIFIQIIDWKDVVGGKGPRGCNPGLATGS